MKKFRIQRHVKTVGGIVKYEFYTVEQFKRTWYFPFKRRWYTELEGDFGERHSRIFDSSHRAEAYIKLLTSVECNYHKRVVIQIDFKQ